MNHVFAVSDGTGGTAQRAVKAALAQFADIPTQIHVCAEVLSEERILEIVSDAKQLNAFIVHTLVEDDLRDFMLRICRENNVEAIDLMGPLLARLSEQLDVTPSHKPGLFRQLNEAYFRRIETMEFALRHDDGARIADVDQAEIVILGVSRTFKTPISVYLAFKGWFVANVPIILNFEPQEVIKVLPRTRIVGLTMNARRLSTLRHSRDTYLHGKESQYSDLEYIRRELIFALRYYDTLQIPVIDVTGKPIEEIAAEIIAATGQRRDDLE